MQKYLEHLFAAEGDATQQVIDLIIFLTYFAVCLYAGGVAYESSYNASFNLPIRPNIGDPKVAVSFVTNVLLKKYYWIPAVFYNFYSYFLQLPLRLETLVRLFPFKLFSIYYFYNMRRDG